MIFLEKYIRDHENDNIEWLEKNRVTQSTHYISKIDVISTNIYPVRQSRVIKHIYTVDYLITYLTKKGDTGVQYAKKITMDSKKFDRLQTQYERDIKIDIITNDE